MGILEKIANFIFDDNKVLIVDKTILPRDIYLQYQIAQQNFEYADKSYVDAAIYELCRLESQITSLRKN